MALGNYLPSPWQAEPPDLFLRLPSGHPPAVQLYSTLHLAMGGKGLTPRAWLKAPISSLPPPPFPYSMGLLLPEDS